jgi:hypothetical protein
VNHRDSPGSPQVAAGIRRVCAPCCRKAHTNDKSRTFGDTAGTFGGTPRTLLPAAYPVPCSRRHTPRQGYPSRGGTPVRGPAPGNPAPGRLALHPATRPASCGTAGIRRVCAPSRRKAHTDDKSRTLGDTAGTFGGIPRTRWHTPRRDTRTRRSHGALPACPAAHPSCSGWYGNSRRPRLGSAAVGCCVSGAGRRCSRSPG